MKVQKLKKNIIKVFLSEFGQKPRLIFSPGRINLIGEHTDYNDGFTLPAAVNRGIVLGIAPSRSDISTLFALDLDDIYKFYTSSIKTINDAHWTGYIVGVVKQLHKRGFQIPPFNMVFAGNIPIGSGMSSSAALENSVVYALNSEFNLKLCKLEMVKISQQAEHESVGVKCGIMDQYASMFGQKNEVLLLDCRAISSLKIPFDLKDYRLLLINTNVKHKLAESAYNSRRTTCEYVAKQLKIKALRDASIDDLNSIKLHLYDEDFQKAKYVIEENNRVHEFTRAIEAKDFKKLGQLLYESHSGLSNMYKVSCDELDYLVDLTKGKAEILGARLMGGGFGGCTINIIKKSYVKEFKKTTKKAYKQKFGKPCSFYKVKLNDGTRLL